MGPGVGTLGRFRIRPLGGGPGVGTPGEVRIPPLGVGSRRRDPGGASLGGVPRGGQDPAPGRGFPGSKAGSDPWGGSWGRLGGGRIRPPREIVLPWGWGGTGPVPCGPGGACGGVLGPGAVGQDPPPQKGGCPGAILGGEGQDLSTRGCGKPRRGVGPPRVGGGAMWHPLMSVGGEVLTRGVAQGRPRSPPCVSMKAGCVLVQASCEPCTFSCLLARPRASLMRALCKPRASLCELCGSRELREAVPAWGGGGA